MEHKELLLGLVSVTNKGQELIPHKDYEIKQDGEKFYLVKKKREYPKTYEECCEIIHSDPKFYVDTHLYSGTLGTLYKLLICRDAYWKIAGEEMGLGKPWEPDWKNNLQHKYYISTEWDEIKTNFNSTTNKVLAFPTPEMQDAFKENFKNEIEICKEFL